MLPLAPLTIEEGEAGFKKRVENSRFDPYAIYEFPEPVEQQQGDIKATTTPEPSGAHAARLTRVFFGARPLTGTEQCNRRRVRRQSLPRSAATPI